MTTLRHDDQFVDSSNPLPVTHRPVTPLDTHFDSSVVATVESVPEGARELHFLACQNPNGVDIFLQLFDFEAGDITLGTTVPKQSYLIPASGWLDERWNPDAPMLFRDKMSYAATTTVTGSTAPGTGIVLNMGVRP